LKGIWKNKLCGYIKDSRRKKQTLKHYIKDNGKAIHRHFINEWKNPDRKHDKNVFRIENEVENKFTNIDLGITEEVTSVDICKIRWNGKIFFAYYFNGWRDEISHELIIPDWDSELNDMQPQVLHVIKTIPFDDPVGRKKDQKVYTGSTGDSTRKEFIFGKPLLKKDINWGNGKRGKIAQKFSHKRDRRIIRDWLIKKDYEKEIPTHHTSKSLLWELW